jgi:hypothetical protein
MKNHIWQAHDPEFTRRTLLRLAMLALLADTARAAGRNSPEVGNLRKLERRIPGRSGNLLLRAVRSRRLGNSDAFSGISTLPLRNALGVPVGLAVPEEPEKESVQAKPSGTPRAPQATPSCCSTR